MNLTPRNKVLLAGVGVVLLVIILLVVLVVPQWQKMNALDAEIVAAEQDYTAAQTLLEQRRQIRDEAAVTDAGLIQLANAVPENPELPSLVIELQDLAYRLRDDNDAGILIRGVQPADPIPSETGSYVIIPVEIEILGSWEDTVDYLNGLSDMVRAVRIVQFNSAPLELTAARDAGLETPPYYYVRTTIAIEVYVIPAADQPDAAAPAAVPPAQ